ncbi:platelet-activating factor acetylhydrolase isoform II [Mobilisporobacter senegalensis]|uniref:Platelet-activating factor acetylhydrolase isoform II n=1 Tax=Mobilisporobacter senegalensis TaxID=1329262 RepID=A0A3N1XS52_9FIRM|nr:hypothetical protein [Mobilisporobacter senegalensis]ROR29068.1 platelet-activating factor acetylhydrolase isoform II [Mobilisporobacter senegalensis]
MTGIIILTIGIIVNIGFAMYCIKINSHSKDIKSYLHIISFVLFSFLIIFKIIKWGFQWTTLFTLLSLQALIGLWYIIRKKKKAEKTYTTVRIIIICISNCLLITFAIIPAILFPQYEPLAQTGNYNTRTMSYTLTDPDRIESYSNQTENRKVSIQFWYPESENEKFPLVIFSHGAFGFRGSNYSTFVELASNGYVVCSIDHTYQSFFTQQVNGEVAIVNVDFLNDAIAIQNNDYNKREEFELTHNWLNLRLADTNLIIDNILSKASSPSSDEVFQMINTEKIGMFGHSLGGATAAQIGRERNDIDAVIVVDGTMIGEVTGLDMEKEILNNTPYPIPILNLYNEEHYKDALDNSSIYANMVVTSNASAASQVVIKGSGHLNFTDLPMFSPFIANMLGTGKVDSRYCIKTMNQIILDYFDHYLKNTKELNLMEEY